MKREFTTVMRSFRLFADVFDLSAILPKLVCKSIATLIILKCDRFGDFPPLCNIAREFDESYREDKSLFCVSH